MEDQIFIQALRDLIHGLYSNYRLQNSKICQQHDLTSPQASILMILKHKKALKVSEVAELINTPDSNVSAICGRLEQKNLIKRVRDEADRRSVYITSTPEAEHIFEEFEQDRQRIAKTICDNISDVEKEQIVNALERLNQVLEKAMYTEK